MNLPTHHLPTRIERADFARSAYFLQAAPGTTPEQVMDPDYWTHLARRLRVNDTIEIIAADGTFDMEVRVTGLDPRGLWAHVRPLRLSEGKFAVASSPTGQYPDAEGYTVEWGGPHRWRIIRGNDVVARDFADQAAAVEALMNIKTAKRGAPIPLVPRMSDPRPPEPEPEPVPVEEPPGEAEEPPADEPEGTAAERARTRSGQFAAKPKPQAA